MDKNIINEVSKRLIGKKELVEKVVEKMDSKDLKELGMVAMCCLTTYLVAKMEGKIEIDAKIKKVVISRMDVIQLVAEN